MPTETTQTLFEIRPSEFAAHLLGLREALEDICDGTAFRTSPKSREFLRHIVEYTLAGRTDELKERLIGMTLLGRDASYDTGSDAGVRVRANEVRKRLAAHYLTLQARSEISIDLPVGSYVPRFFRSLDVEAEAPAPVNTPLEANLFRTPSPLSLYQLAGPTLVALFLCIMCIRWQVAQEHPFTSFWSRIFEGHASMLYLPETADGSASQIQKSEMEAMRTAAPLLNLAGQFHTNMKIVNAPDATETKDSVLITVGESGGSAELAHKTLAAESQFAMAHHLRGWRLIPASTSEGERIVDTAEAQGAKPGFKMPSHAALLTIVNDSSHAVHIDGTDEQSISGLVELLCSRDTFPSYIDNPFQDGTVVQVLFPMQPSATAIIYRQPLHDRAGLINAGGLQ